MCCIYRLFYNPDTGEIILHILEVFPQDTGVYRCEAVNEHGKAVTTAHLDVQGKCVFFIFYIILREEISFVCLKYTITSSFIFY